MEFNFRDLRAETKGWEFLGWKKNQLFFFFFSFETSGTRERVRSLFRSCMERWSATTCHEIAISNQLSLSLSFRGSRENNIEISVVCKHDDCDADASRPARNRKHQLGQSMANVRSSPHVFFFSFFFFLSSSFLARSFLSPLTLPSSAVFFRAPIESGSTPLAGSGTSHRAVSATDFSRLSTAFFRTPSISEYRVGDGESIRQLFIDAYLYGPVARSKLRIELGWKKNWMG